VNKIEEIKAERDGIDVLDDLERYAREGWEAITDDDKERLKWFGVFFRKHTPGHFMQRVRFANGIATSAQLRALAALATDYGRELIDVTTRQQLQLRWFRIEHVPDLFARLDAVGLHSRQTGMDNIRGVVGCPLAGLSANELLDASPIAQAFTARFVGDRAFTNLPRKFNVTITGCTENCTHAETQDIGLTPATKEIDGQTVAGLNLRVGGKQGSGGYHAAAPLDVFVRPEEAVDVCTAVTLLFRDHGPRVSRSKARLAFLVDEWGPARFRAELEARLGRTLLPAGHDVRGRHSTDHLGIVPQRRQGYYSVGLLVPVGRTTAAQLRELARLADIYGSGEVRMSVGQNFLLPNVPDTRLPALLGEPLLRELRPDPPALLRGLVSCTGVEFCNLALAETKARALEVAGVLEAYGGATRPLHIAWSGCPAACANHLTADIGLQGGKTRIDGEVVETFQIFVGGRSGPNARPALPLVANVPATRVADVLAALVDAHNAGEDLQVVGPALTAASQPGRDGAAAGAEAAA
jgi:ferredoxin-nitrite reductase